MPVKIHVGDIVAFRVVALNEKTHVIVHRAVSITVKGIVTRGDNNPEPDPIPVTSGRILGIVNCFSRGSTTRKLHGGLAGLFQSRFLRMRTKCLQPFREALKRCYILVRNSRLCAKCWHPRLTELHFQTPYGKSIKYVWRKRTIAQWWPDNNRFVCKKPFDLFLDPPSRQLDKPE